LSKYSAISNLVKEEKAFEIFEKYALKVSKNNALLVSEIVNLLV
jgi:hypothetical protein